MPPRRRENRIEAPARFHKVVGQRDQGPGLDVPLHQVAPPEYETATGNRGVQRIRVDVEFFKSGIAGRATSGREPSVPRRPPLSGSRIGEKGQAASARNRPVQRLRMVCGIAGCAEGHERLPGYEDTVIRC